MQSAVSPHLLLSTFPTAGLVRRGVCQPAAPGQVCTRPSCRTWEAPMHGGCARVRHGPLTWCTRKASCATRARCISCVLLPRFLPVQHQHHSGAAAPGQGGSGRFCLCTLRSTAAVLVLLVTRRAAVHRCSLSASSAPFPAAAGLGGGIPPGRRQWQRRTAAAQPEGRCSVLPCVQRADR